LHEFWAGNAEWVVEVYDVGLPVGESDTVYRGQGVFWSYLNTDHHRTGVKDSCKQQVPYPGCVTLWKSHDGGLSFRLDRPTCLFRCTTCPCDQTDHVEQQQYPRVFFDTDRAYMVYEWGGGTFMRTSDDTIHWSGEVGIPGTGVWYTTQRPCTEAELVGEHPYVYSGLEYDCLAGAPPGIYIDGDLLYVFVGLGRAPGHMGCFVGNKYEGAAGLHPCESNPLFSAEADDYGPLDVVGAEANPYFDFRTISSAEVVRLGNYYYMAYEGTRGPTSYSVREDQFALGFARSISSTIDGPWEKYPGNPVITDVGDNWGIGHADILIVDGITYLYASTSPTTRGRYVLVRK
jgi:beta-xylosidase